MGSGGGAVAGQAVCLAGGATQSESDVAGSTLRVGGLETFTAGGIAVSAEVWPCACIVVLEVGRWTGSEAGVEHEV